MQIGMLCYGTSGKGRKRLKIMVSACLAGENRKYNGGNNRNDKILRLMEENEVITVCPEQTAGS